MAQTKTFHGARAFLYMGNETKGMTKMGIFNSVSYTRTFDISPTYVIGRLGPGELVTTAYEPVGIQASAFRVLGNGPHGSMAMPKIQELLDAEDVTIVIVDRQNSVTEPVMIVEGCKFRGDTGHVASRSLSEVQVNLEGLIMSDESGQQSEPAGSVVYGD